MKPKFLPLILVLFLGQIAVSENICDSTCDSCQKCRDISISANEASIVFKKARGRLGNQLNNYAMLLTLKLMGGYQAYLLKETYDILARMFTKESIELPVFEDTFCNHEKIKFRVFDGNFTELILPNSPHQNGQIYSLFPPQEKKVFVPPLTLAYKKARAEIYKQMNKNLKIKPEHIKSAKETFEKVSEKLKVPMDKLTFVGIHHRKTDIEAFAKEAFKEHTFKKSYFYDAMEHYREEFDPVAFLYVSDDMAWGKKNIKNKKKDLFFVGRGNSNDDADVGHDFALMVHSNHSVTTLGSFSRWISILNAGDTYGKYGPVSRSIITKGFFID